MPHVRRANPTKRLEARLDSLKAQLVAIRELTSWASTSKRELEKIYNDSLANLKQARAAIYRAKGKNLAGYQQPRGFEIETVRVGTGTTYPYSGTTVPVMPPDDFRLFIRVTFPEEWVRERTRLSISCQVYPDSYLPMASRYQNTNKAVYRVYSRSQQVLRSVTTFNVRVNGLSLPEGRYFTSCRVSDTKWPPTFLISLGMFQVKGDLPRAVAERLPHYTDWYRTYKSVLTLDKAEAKVRGKAIQLGGSYTRKEFERGQEPVYVVAVAERAGDKTVILRRKQRLARGSMKFGGRQFLVSNHKLKPGQYKVKLGVYTEHPSSKSKYAYQRGSRAEKTIDVTIP
jgi:hypothetical protein